MRKETGVGPFVQSGMFAVWLPTSFDPIPEYFLYPPYPKYNVRLQEDD